MYSLLCPLWFILTPNIGLLLYIFVTTLNVFCKKAPNSKQYTCLRDGGGLCLKFRKMLFRRLKTEIFWYV